MSTEMIKTGGGRIEMQTEERFAEGFVVQEVEVSAQLS